MTTNMENSEAAKTLSAALGDSGLAGEIISAILGVLDMLAEGGVGGIVSGLTDTVLDSVNGILDDVFSGGIVTKPLKSVVDGVGGILDTVTFGGFGSWFGGGNAKETAEKTARLTESNDYLRTSIDRLTEKMDESAGGKALGYYEEAKDAQERFNENLRQILDAQMRYTSAHHSNAYYWDLDDDSLRQVNALLGTSLANEWTDFSKLTAEQMDEIRTRLPDVWEEMINEGKYGDRFRDDWENYADQAGKVEELTEQLRDNITQTSFDSLRSGFLDTLMDMDSDAQDFADDFSEMMQRALLNFAMGDLMDDRLKEWYESLADDISASGGDWSGIDIGKYRDEWDGMAEEWLGMRDAISEITGYTGDGGGTAQNGTGVVEEDVNLRMFRLDFGDEGVERLAVGEVAVVGVELPAEGGHFAFDLAAGFELGADADDVGPGFRQSERDSTADPAAAAGDQCGFPIQFELIENHFSTSSEH